MTDYRIEWDGKTVTLPPAGELRPRAPWPKLDGSVSLVMDWDGDPNEGHHRRLIEYSDAIFEAQGKRRKKGMVHADVVLISLPDNPPPNHDGEAVWVAMPKNMGGSPEDRCLGWVHQSVLYYWATFNDGRRDLIARLAAFSEDGEVHFTTDFWRNEWPDFKEEFRYRDVGVRLDLPPPRIMGPAIRDFLAKHERDRFGYEVLDLDPR